MSKNDTITSTTTQGLSSKNRRSKRSTDNTVKKTKAPLYTTKSRKKKTIKDEILSSFLVLKIIRRIARGILIAFTWYYCVIVLLDGGTLYYCKEYRSVTTENVNACPENVVTHENKRWSLFKRKKEYEPIAIEEPLAKDELWKENMCTNSIELLQRMRQKVRFLRYVKSNVAESASITCPQHVPSKKPPKKGLFQRFIKAFKKKPKTNKQQSNEITGEQDELIKTLSSQIPEYINDKNEEPFHSRIDKVHWGGSNNVQWWSNNDQGYALLYAYLKIMEWPQDLMTIFPFKPCKHDQCPAAFAIYHTLLFREAYQPWLVTQSMIAENKLGYIYHHGYNPKDKSTFVWYTPGLHKPQHHESYIRCIVHAFESAIHNGLTHSNHIQGGKYHVILDCSNFSLSLFPNFHDVKRLVTIFQDHFPNKLGKIIVVNANTATTLFYNLLWPLLTDCVRQKFIILQNKNKDKRLKEMIDLMGGGEFIPKHLGGPDDFVFDAHEFYANNGLQGTDEMALQYLTRMPYHA